MRDIIVAVATAAFLQRSGWTRYDKHWRMAACIQNRPLSTSTMFTDILQFWLHYWSNADLLCVGRLRRKTSSGRGLLKVISIHLCFYIKVIITCQRFPTHPYYLPASTPTHRTPEDTEPSAKPPRRLSSRPILARSRSTRSRTRSSLLRARSRPFRAARGGAAHRRRDRSTLAIAVVLVQTSDRQQKVSQCPQERRSWRTLPIWSHSRSGSHSTPSSACSCPHAVVLARPW